MKKPTVEKDGRLKTPIVVNGVSIKHERFNFVTYQLNTTDLSGNEGVKNLCYYEAADSSDNELYSAKLSKLKLPYLTHKNLQRYALDHLEYNPNLFKKLLALILFNGSAADAPALGKSTAGTSNAKISDEN